MSKNKKTKVEDESLFVDDGTRPIEPIENISTVEDNSKEQFAVSIIPTLKNNNKVFNIVRFTLNELGSVKNKEVLHSTINEHTAMNLLFQAAHETFTVKELRKQVKELKGGN